jgi:hypothetical protein
MKHYLFLFLTALLAAGSLPAQEQAPKQRPAFLRPVPEQSRRYTIAFELLSPNVLNNGIRLSFEKRIGQSRSWWQVAPSWHYLSYDKQSVVWMVGNQDTEASIHGLKGAGLSVHYKLFFDTPEYFYCKGGAAWQFVNVAYAGREWGSYREDGLTFYTYEWVEKTQHLNNVGLQLSAGLQSSIKRNRLFIDAGVGVGYTHSFREAGKQAFDNHPYNFGYSGFLFLFDVRIGFAFGKTKNAADGAAAAR